MTPTDIDSMTNEQIAEAVAGVMGLYPYYDNECKGLWWWAKKGTNEIVLEAMFSPCTDANDDLIVLEWAIKDGLDQHLVGFMISNLGLAYRKRASDGGHNEFYVGENGELISSCLLYQPGDYARAFLHADREVSDGEYV